MTWLSENANFIHSLHLIFPCCARKKLTLFLLCSKVVCYTWKNCRHKEKSFFARKQLRYSDFRTKHILTLMLIDVYCIIFQARMKLFKLYLFYKSAWPLNWRYVIMTESEHPILLAKFLSVIIAKAPNWSTGRKWLRILGGQSFIGMSSRYNCARDFNLSFFPSLSLLISASNSQLHV